MRSGNSLSWVPSDRSLMRHKVDHVRLQKGGRPTDRGREVISVPAPCGGSVIDVSDVPTAANAGIVLLCGRSFSGKSTVAAELASDLRAVVVSLDSINAERGFQSGAGVPMDEWVRTHEISRSRTRDSVASGVTVIVDDTSSPRFLRDGWRSLAREIRVPLVLVYVDTPVEVAIQRHAANRDHQRRMDVTDEILREHLDSFEAPTPDEDPVRYSTSGGDFDATLRQVRQRLMAAGD